MKKFIFIILLAVAVGVKAEQTEVLVVALKNNTTVEFILNESPKIQFSADSLYITSSTLSDTYAYAQVRNIHFDMKDIVGIRDARVPQNIMRILDEGADRHTVAVLSSTDKVTVFNITGHKIAQIKVSGDAADISLREYPSGTYLINIAGKHSFKVFKR